MCRKHKIEENLRTPMRNHIVFPDTLDRKDINFVPGTKIKLLLKKRPVSEELLRETDPVILTNKSSTSDANIVKHSAMVAREYVPHAIKKAKVFVKSGSSDLHRDNHVSILDNDKILWKESPKGTVTSVLSRPISENKKIPLNDNHKVVVLAARRNTTREIFNSSFRVVDCETEKR